MASHPLIVGEPQEVAGAAGKGGPAHDDARYERVEQRIPTSATRRHQVQYLPETCRPHSQLRSLLL